MVAVVAVVVAEAAAVNAPRRPASCRSSTHAAAAEVAQPAKENTPSKILAFNGSVREILSVVDGDSASTQRKKKKKKKKRNACAGLVKKDNVIDAFRMPQ